MAIICRFKDSQLMVGSCRGYLPANTLINNAITEGLGTFDQFEEIIFNLPEYDQYIAEYALAHPRPPDPSIALIRSFAQKMIGLGFTKAELKTVFRYIAVHLD